MIREPKIPQRALRAPTELSEFPPRPPASETSPLRETPRVLCGTLRDKSTLQRACEPPVSEANPCLPAGRPIRGMWRVNSKILFNPRDLRAKNLASNASQAYDGNVLFSVITPNLYF